ncbi:MAG: cytochrome c [Opitutaceae bacterium]
MKPDSAIPPTGHERTGAITLTGLRLVALVGVSLMATACGRHERDGANTTGATLPAKSATGNHHEQQPRIAQTSKEQDGTESGRLDTYGWVNRASGLLHIPIDRAMDLMLAEKSSRSAPNQAPTPYFLKPRTSLERTGRRLMHQFGCVYCHDPDAANHAPSLIGIYGQRVRLSDGTFVRADDQYLHDSIMHASKQLVAGYLPGMPGYSTMIGEDDLRELIAYLKSTSGAASTSNLPVTP